MLKFLCGVSLATMLGSAPCLAAETLATQIPDIVAAGTAVPAGKPAPDQVLNLVLSLPLRNQPRLTQLIADIYNPASPNFRHYLSVAEFTESFGPAASDYQTVVDYLTARGLTVTKPSVNRYLIEFDATVADVERVFHVQMGLYQHPAEKRLFISPDRAPRIDLNVPVLQILGLDDYVRPYRKLVHKTGVTGPRNGSGPDGQFDGNDIRRAYYPSGTLTGAGQSVGLMELDGLAVADVNSFFRNGYGPANTVPIDLIKVANLTTACNYAVCDDTEQALDVEYTISMAPGLASVRVYIALNPEKILNAMATDNISKILSTSWGWSNQNAATDDGLFQEFAAQGQTNLTASGDYSTLKASGAWPEEDANIVGVGGTDLSMTGDGAAWSGETGWSSSAGGPSIDHIPIEPYQTPYVTAKNGGSKKLRNVPDVAANANVDMYLCADGSCAGQWGGTSFASPIWAGFIALTNQYATSHGKQVVGFINPAIYALGKKPGIYKKAFYDETVGQSGRFICTPSYDLVTGLGSPTGEALIEALVP
jgi:subtilase family serine protease